MRGTWGPGIADLKTDEDYDPGMNRHANNGAQYGLKQEETAGPDSRQRLQLFFDRAAILLAAA
ncbi:hypothetical protein FHS18_000644 [Paenibacillus phyllosphaerae]|uniref:Uncharacterized protein n=1 Tax=Paenibacillus phyllosphaerae TaxID=274593 RepID=A0A7W5AUQ7_9BACL|nr:hypothetical protein [Paenibacillus phyllosphaerae]MBB3108616.1 hypothetical protein [Paenibacillus phyllosphaerae]